MLGNYYYEVMFVVVLALIFVVSICAAIFGVLTGLGGGMLIIPLLSSLQIDLRHAMGVSLISIISLSLMTATTKTSQLFTNIKIGIFLETAAILGAFSGAALLPFLSIKIISMVFGLILIVIVQFKKNNNSADDSTPAMQYVTTDLKNYPGSKLLMGWLSMGVAGLLSGVLGIGSGSLKVLALERILGLPYRVSTATSNFMVGITAAAGIGLYLMNNYISYDLVFPVICGVYVGSKIGSKLLLTTQIHILRKIFNVVIYILGFSMLYKGAML